MPPVLQGLRRQQSSPRNQGLTGKQLSLGTIARGHKPTARACFYVKFLHFIHHEFFIVLILSWGYVYWLFKRERRREREKEKQMHVIQKHRSNPQPRHVPQPGIEPKTLGVRDDAPINWATLSGQMLIFFYFKKILDYWVFWGTPLNFVPHPPDPILRAAACCNRASQTLSSHS